MPSLARESRWAYLREVAEELKLARKTIESSKAKTLNRCRHGSSVDMLNPIQSLLVLMQTRWPQS